MGAENAGSIRKIARASGVIVAVPMYILEGITSYPFLDHVDRSLRGLSGWQSHLFSEISQDLRATSDRAGNFRETTLPNPGNNVSLTFAYVFLSTSARARTKN